MPLPAMRAAEFVSRLKGHLRSVTVLAHHRDSAGLTSPQVPVGLVGHPAKTCRRRNNCAESPVWQVVDGRCLSRYTVRFAYALPMHQRRAVIDGHAERLTNESCLICQYRGDVIVARARLVREQLHWRCRNCGAIWTGPERRNADDSTEQIFLVDQSRRRTDPKS